MSSRNAYLSNDERQASTVLYHALTAANELFTSGQRDANELRNRMESVLAAEPLARPDYTSVAHLETLEELEGPIESALLSLAVYVGKTRLIDNMTVGE